MIRSLVLIFILLAVMAHTGYSQLSGSPAILKSKSLFEKRSFAEAKSVLNQVDKTSYDFATAQYYLGRIAVEEKQYDESIARFETAIEANPKIAEYHNWLGVMSGVIAMGANKFKQAYLAPKIKHEFEQAAALDPTNIQTQWGLVTYYTKAPRILGGGYDKALACAKTIARLNSAQGLRASAFVHAAQERNTQAEQEYKDAMKLEPANPDNAYALGQFYSDQKQYDKALALYELLMKSDPNNMLTAFHMGQTTAECGKKMDKGIRCLNHYLRYTPKPNEPSQAVANLFLAMIYEKMGDKPKASAYYETSLKLQPGMKEAEEGLQRMR